MQTIVQAQDSLLQSIWSTPMECNGQYQLLLIPKDKVAKPRPLKEEENPSEIAYQESSKGDDVYFAMARFKDGSSRKSENVIGSKAFYLDLDCGLEKVKNGKGYATQKDAVEALVDFIKQTGLPRPSFIINSGNGLHVYYVLDTEIPKVEWKITADKLKALTKFYALIADDAVTADISRVLRVSGTKNFKDPQNPKDVKILSVGMHLNANGFISKVDVAYNKIENLKPQVEPLTKLPAAYREPLPFSAENAAYVLEVCGAAYPEGVPDRQTYRELGHSLAHLYLTGNWPELEVRSILEFVASKPEAADRTNNDAEWQNCIDDQRKMLANGTITDAHGKSSILTLGSIIYKAKENGWRSKPKSGDALAAVQKKFALILLAGKVGVVDREDLEVRGSDGSAAPLWVMNRGDGAILISRYLSSEFPQTDSNAVFNTFIYDSQTTMYKGVEFNPGETSKGALNLWVGMTIKPHEGSWPFIKTLLFEVLCGGRETEYQYLIKFIAHAIQRPWEKPGVMIIMLGGQGIGKGTLAKILKKIWSATFLQVNRVKQVVGDFNGSLERAYIVFLDEALFVGDKSSSEALKNLVTEPVVGINEKHQPARQITSYHRFFSASNADHFKSTERDDRRDFVLRVSEHRKGDHEFWKALNAEIENGGVNALVSDLLGVDLTDFNVREKVNTRELTEQKLQSLDRFPRWWFDRLYQGRVFSTDTEWPEFVSSEKLISAFHEDERSLRTYKQLIDRDLVNIIKKICPSAKYAQKMDGKFRRRGYLLPSLELARQDFESFIGDSVDWEVS